MSERRAAAQPLDVDRVTSTPGLAEVARRRLEGRFPIDAFGADPHIQDLVAPVVTGVVRVEIHGAPRLPRAGAALLVSNRGLGLVEPVALGVAVRRAVGRRLRVVGVPDVPVLGGVARKLGGISYRPDDVAVALRAGHLVAVPLGPTWLRRVAGEPPRVLLAAALGTPVIPVAVVAGGPFGLPLRPWQIRVGEPFNAPRGAKRGDSLAAAELAERARAEVADLLDLARQHPG